MFFEKPESISHVPGVTLECKIFEENIASEKQRHALVSEFLRIIVQHDGSNLFCDKEACSWIVIALMSTDESLPEIVENRSSSCMFVCFPNGINVTHALVCETIYCGIAGIWLLLTTNDESGENDCGFILSRYVNAC